MWNSPEYLKDIFDYKSNRRQIVINSINEFYNLDTQQLVALSEAFEALHFAVTTVDDMIDNETFRNDAPCFYVRKGYDKSVIASFSTFIHFLEITSRISKIDNSLICELQKMLMTEEADIGLRKREYNKNPLDWYIDNCCTKTSYEFIVMLLVFDSLEPNSQFENIKNLFFEIGRMAQMTNDTRDLMTDRPLLRYSQSDKIKLTYNLPLAIFLNNIDAEMENRIGLNISREEFIEIHNKLNTKYIVQNIKHLLERQKSKIDDLLNNNLGLNKPLIKELINKIYNLEFYKQLENYEIFSK